MPHLRLPLAIAAAALLLAAVPDGASANSAQHCRNQWNASSASDSCTHNLSVSYNSGSGQCSIFVGCNTGSGGFHNQQVNRAPSFVPYYINCNGFLKLSQC